MALHITFPGEEYRHWNTASLACLYLGGFSPHQTLCKQPARRQLTSSVLGSNMRKHIQAIKIKNIKNYNFSF